MKKHGWVLVLTALLFSLLVMAGCGTSAPVPAVSAVTVIPPQTTVAPSPTDTPIPPSDTPAPTDTPTSTATPTDTPTATATSSPTTTSTPTNTPTSTPTRKPPTVTPAPSTLQGALQRTANRSHRFEISMFYSDPYRETETLNAHGEQTSQAAHMYIGGLLGNLLGGPNGIEEIVTKDKVYIHGPVPILKANEAKWYLVPPSKDGAKSTGAVKTDQLLTPAVTHYDKIGSETMDGVSCDIYTIDKEAARKALAASGAMTAKELDNMVNIELTYWWCADGYIHHARVRMDLKYPLDPSTTMIARIETHYFDFDAGVQVSVPTDAVPLPQ